MRVLLGIVIAAGERGRSGLLACCRAGSGKDIWGEQTLVNYPAGQTRKTVPVQANDDGVQPPIDLPCQCSDADPRSERAHGEWTQELGVDCFYQRHFGNCNLTYMFDANAELAPEGFCQMSCSRCNCCQSPYEVLQGLGATRFLQALEATQPSLKDLLQHPGYTATLLVPSNAAFDAALAQYAPLLQDPALLQQLIKFHIVPPEPVRNGLWSSTLLSVGPKLYTAYDGPQTLRVPKFDLPANVTWQGGLAGFKVQGPFNSATVTKSDVPACKSLITLIDAVLLPFNPASPPPADYLAPAAVLGAQGCAVAPNTLITGQEAKAGDANRQPTIGACCASCAATSGCNAWRYCSQKAGCRMPDRTLLKYGHCALLRSGEIAAGQPAIYEDWSAVTVPLVSGYIVSRQAASAGGTQPVVAGPAQPAAEPLVAAAGGQPAGGRRLFQ